MRLRSLASTTAFAACAGAPAASTTTIELNAGSSVSVKSIDTACGAATAAFAGGSLFSGFACANAALDSASASAAARPRRAREVIVMVIVAFFRTGNERSREHDRGPRA